MSSIFTKIINREIPGQFIYEDNICVALLDKFPAVPGQALVIPKKEVDYIFDLDDETYQHLLAVTKKIATALDNTFNPERTCVVIEGFEVPHTHVKLYPMPKGAEPLGITVASGQEESDETLSKIAEEIKANL